jgi:hypothetical protein
MDAPPAGRRIVGRSQPPRRSPPPRKKKADARRGIEVANPCAYAPPSAPCGCRVARTKPADRSWGCPIRQCWGLRSHQQLSPALEEKLPYFATVAGSYAASSGRDGQGDASGTKLLCDAGPADELPGAGASRVAHRERCGGVGLSRAPMSAQARRIVLDTRWPVALGRARRSS